MPRISVCNKNIADQSPLFFLSQVLLLLCIADWMVHSMWQSGKDPDSFSIPYLTALGDLLGTALLALSFHFLWVIGDQDSDVGDWVTVAASAVTGTMLFCHATSHTHSLVGMWVLYVAGQHIPPLHFTLAVWELFSVPGFFSEYTQKTWYSVFLDCSHCLHQSTCVMQLVSLRRRARTGMVTQKCCRSRRCWQRGISWRTSAPNKS